MSELNFTAFVISLASSAAIHFGDAVDPNTGQKHEPNLVGATQMIGILMLLEQKTKGNLTAEERQLLEQVIYELQVRFIELSGGAPGATPGGAVTGTSAAKPGGTSGA